MKRYDFGLSWSGTIKEYFVDCLQKSCKEKNISFFWVNEDNIRKVLGQLESASLKITVMLDTEATYNKKNDPYARSCYAVKDNGGVVINDPDRTKIAIDKSVMHYELMHMGIAVPYSVIVRNWEPNSFKLTEEERKKLGVPFIIKPALGYGQLGVVREARGSIREIARARSFDRGDNFLLQEKITPIELGTRRAWFRVLHVFNTIIPCWWDDNLNRYEHVSLEEFNSYNLFPLVAISSKIASATRMVWFSTEVAIDKHEGKLRFIAIDYVNDQCDMSAKSETTSGVPDGVVFYTAQCIVDSAYRFVNRVKEEKKYTILLKDASIVDIRGLGTPPTLLKQLPPGVSVPKSRRRIFKFLQ